MRYRTYGVFWLNALARAVWEIVPVARPIKQRAKVCKSVASGVYFAVADEIIEHFKNVAPLDVGYRTFAPSRDKLASQAIFDIAHAARLAFA